MNIWDLPQSLDVAGSEYRINADYRDIIDIVSRLNDQEEDEQTRVYVAMALFYAEFGTMPEKYHGEARDRMFWFINGGEEDSSTSPRPKTIDWEQDRLMIVADINKVAGCEVRALPFCHWWTFLAWFNGIGDGQLATVVSIREKLRKGKELSEWERDFYRDNRNRVDFKTTYTKSDQDVLKLWGA